MAVLVASAVLRVRMVGAPGGIQIAAIVGTAVVAGDAATDTWEAAAAAAAAVTAMVARAEIWAGMAKQCCSY
jgi:hypothetical protein